MNHFYVIMATTCFGLGIGIFIVLYFLEKPFFRVVFSNDTNNSDKIHDIKRVASTLNQYADNGLPFVMASQMLVGITCSAFLVLYHPHTFFNVMVLCLAILMIVIAAIFVPGAVNKLRIFSSSKDDINLLAPIFRAHFYGGIFLTFIVLLQLIGILQQSTNLLPNTFMYPAWLS